LLQSNATLAPWSLKVEQRHNERSSRNDLPPRQSLVAAFPPGAINLFLPTVPPPAGRARHRLMTTAHPPPGSLETRAPLPQRLLRHERLGIAALAIAMVTFGFITEARSAFLKHHHTDLDVYLRAAWAVRKGLDIYTVVDEHNWHYHYPPLFAILMVPLADPPPDEDRAGTLPFAASVAIWYVVSIGLLVLGVDMLARAIEARARGPAAHALRGSRQWWGLRIVPIVACIPAIGLTLTRGQVNLLLLMMLCAMIAAILRGRSAWAGACLAGAICLKVFPAYLLVYALWRRDARMIAGCALGLTLGLVAIPAAVFGPSRTLAYTIEWKRVLIEPVLTAGGDTTREKELTGIHSTHSQSFQSVIHKTVHLRETLLAHSVMPQSLLSPVTRAAHWAIGGLLTLLTLAAAGTRRASDDALREVILLGCLMIIMALLSPVCYLHYLVVSLPIVMAFVAHAWERRGDASLGAGWRTLIGFNIAANGLPQLPWFGVLKDLGLATYGSLTLWATGLRVMRERALDAE
jgi:alpha-1,2-mannosyltransferase